ncbi:hypothetical protein [Kitasatospora sp. NPDC002965]|uniref:hypothetical protein n=1 Tax=Kitasatospora sp. NPDC002965 TaxID=3154775 RepID=UPI0033B19CEA
MSRRRLNLTGTLAKGSMPTQARTPPWVPTDVPVSTVVQQRVLVAEFNARVGAWRELIAGVDDRELRRIETTVRADADRAMAVTSRVRAALRALSRWDQALGELHADLVEAAGPAGPCEWARDAGRAEEIAVRRARAALAEAVLRYHHGAGAAPEDARVW